jgi:hypothetical protein
LNPFILVITAYNHSSEDGFAFPLARATTTEKESQSRKDGTNDGSDCHRQLQPTRHSIVGADRDEGRLIDRPCVMAVRSFTLDPFKCRFPLWRRGHIYALDETT